MAFAKKYTRRITVEGETYLWYFRDNSLESQPRRIVVQQSATPGQMLIVDPFSGPYVLGLEIRPKAIREIILFGLSHGWKPKAKSKPLFLGHNGLHLVELESGIQTV